MRLIEIRDSRGLLVIGPAAIFPPLLHHANNPLARDRALNGLTDKSVGMEQLRRQWERVFPGEEAQRYSDAQLRDHLRRGLTSRHIQALHLSDNLRGMTPAVLSRADDHTLVHLDFPGQTVLIAPRGLLPAELLKHANAEQAAALVGGVGDGHPMAETLGRQAGRVTQEGLAQGRASNLSRHLSRQIELGFLHAAVIAQPQDVKRAAQMPSAPRPFSALTTREKLYAAFLKCLPLVGDDIRKALDQLLKPANLALLIGFLLLFAGLQAIPGVNVVVDIGMLAWLLWTVGTKGPEGIKNVIAGAAIAGNAKSEGQLDAAARLFADGFEDLGEAGISALLVWLQGLRFASRMAKAGNAEAEGGAAAAQQARPKRPAAEPAQPAKPIKRAKPAEEPVKPGQAGDYGDLKAQKNRAGETEPMDMDHQPSYAAQVAAREKALGRKLSPAERAKLKASTPAVASPRKVHQETSPTYGGRNTQAQIEKDAADLAAAKARDKAVFDQAMKKRK